MGKKDGTVVDVRWRSGTVRGALFARGLGDRGRWVAGLIYMTGEGDASACGSEIDISFMAFSG